MHSICFRRHLRMIDESRRTNIYKAAFMFMIENNLDTIPVSPEKICQILNIELVPLTQITLETRLRPEDLFALWGNEDGVLQYYNGKCKIAYNNLQPEVRRRFTLFEEISHCLLGHGRNSAFNMFNQCYDQQTYLRYEEEARMCAGLILCPPQYYYNFPFKMSKCLFQKTYNVSSSCAEARIDILNKYEQEIRNCNFYEILPEIRYIHPVYYMVTENVSASAKKHAII